MPGKHARLSPSSAVRWANCPASVRLDDRVRERSPDGEIPDTSGPAAELGTHAHALAEQEILAAFATEARAAEHRAKADEIMNNPMKLYNEQAMIDNSRVYSDFIIEFVNDFRPTDLDWNVEGRFELWYEPGSHGTSDFWAVDKQQKALYIFDYKSGRIPVQSYKNPQLAIYAIAAYDELKKFNDIERVITDVVQPVVRKERDYWEFDIEELEHIRLQTDRAVREINMPIYSPRYEPSAKACQWCYHKGNCVARDERLNKDHVPDLELREISDRRVFEIHSRAKEHRAFLDAIEARIRDMAPEARVKNDWKLVQGAKKIAWKDEAKAAEALAGAGVTLYDPPKLRSASKIRDEIGDDGALFRALGLVTEKFNKPSLVPADDRRPSLDEGAE